MKNMNEKLKQGLTRQGNNSKVFLLVVIWGGLSYLLFTNKIEVVTSGHLDMSLVVAFALIMLIYHLFSIIKKTVVDIFE